MQECFYFKIKRKHVRFIQSYFKGYFISKGYLFFVDTEEEVKMTDKNLSLDEVMKACRLCLECDGVMCNIFSKTKMKCKEPLNERIHTFFHVKVSMIQQKFSANNFNLDVKT